MNVDRSNDPLLIYSPHDATCTQAWDDRTTDNQRACYQFFKQIAKRVNVQWQIVIQMKGRNPDGSYISELYPLKFASEKDAWDWLNLSPDPALRPVGVKSWSIKALREHKPPIHHPTVRRENLKKA